MSLSDADATLTHVIILNYVIFSNYYRCRHVSFRLVFMLRAYNKTTIRHLKQFSQNTKLENQKLNIDTFYIFSVWWIYLCFDCMFFLFSGILLYEMIYGYTPFRGKNRQRTFANILHKDLRFPKSKQVSLFSLA